jgi:hypothetical protein
MKEFFIGIGALIGLIIVWWVLWAFSVAVSPVIGQGEQYKQINSSTNRTFQYQHFFDLNATIHTQAQNLKVAKQESKDFDKQYPPSSQEPFSITEIRGQKQANVTGLHQICISNVQKYNNDAQEFTRNIFLDKQLPSNINPSICEGE